MEHTFASWIIHSSRKIEYRMANTVSNTNIEFQSSQSDLETQTASEVQISPLGSRANQQKKKRKNQEKQIIRKTTGTDIHYFCWYNVFNLTDSGGRKQHTFLCCYPHTAQAQPMPEFDPPLKSIIPIRSNPFGLTPFSVWKTLVKRIFS